MSQNVPKLIVKPPQGQKTIEALLLTEQALQSPEHPQGLVVFISGNFMSQGNQPLARISDRFGLEPLLLHGSAFRSTQPADIISRIHSGTRLIVCLSNATRLRLLADCLGTVLADPAGHVTIFVDEADQVYRTVEKHVGDSVLSHGQVETFLITATGKTLFERFPTMAVHRNRVGLENYMLMREMETCTVEATGDSLIEDIDDMLKAASPLPADAFVFVPAELRNDSQDTLAAHMAYTHNLNVLIINSRGYTTYAAGCLTSNRFPKRVPPCKTGACLSTGCRRCFPTEFEVIQHFRAQCRGSPLVLTGHGCIGRAIVCHGTELPFTHGLLSLKVIGKTNLSGQKAKDNLYQLCARLSDSFADKAELPAIYSTSSDLLDVLRESEAHAIAAAETLGGMHVTSDDFVKAGTTSILALEKVPMDLETEEAMKRHLVCPGSDEAFFKTTDAFRMLDAVNVKPQIACIFDGSPEDCHALQLMKSFDAMRADGTTCLWTRRCDSHAVVVADFRAANKEFVIVRGVRSSEHDGGLPFGNTISSNK